MCIWKEQEKIFTDAIASLKTPNQILDNVEFVIVKTIVDIDTIPDGGGCYWIWTNEPVNHQFHTSHFTPSLFDGGEFIYNGITRGNVRDRIKNHLSAEANELRSGISMDIHIGHTTSHRKRVFGSDGKKVPNFQGKMTLKRKTKEGKKGDVIKRVFPMKTKVDALSILYLSNTEKDFITNNEPAFFRNGINIADSKHQLFEFRVYYIVGLTSLYLDYIEKKWREDCGLPKLCSYSSGR